MIHPDTLLEVIHTDVGLGVRASVDIPRGTLLWVRDALDVVLTDAEVHALPPRLRAQAERLGYQDSEGRTIVCWDAGKNVNHACAPVMRGVGHDAMIAIRDVVAGDEITCDYAECNLSETLACLCGAPGCRGSIGGPVDSALWCAWQEEVEQAVSAATQTSGLAQPLLEVCVDPRLQEVLAGRLPVPDLRKVGI